MIARRKRRYAFNLSKIACSDVDWDRGRLSVFATKTERHAGKDRRSVPIVPELMAILQDTFDAAEPGQKKIITLSWNSLRRNFHSILDRVGIERWEDCFQTLRRSHETQWATVR